MRKKLNNIKPVFNDPISRDIAIWNQLYNEVHKNDWFVYRNEQIVKDRQHRMIKDMLLTYYNQSMF